MILWDTILVKLQLGNISFLIDGSGFSLAPIYDMCSMGFAQKSAGEIPPYTFSPPDIDGPLNFLKETVSMIKNMAEAFWEKLMKSNLISEDFKHYLEQSTIIDELKRDS